MQHPTCFSQIIGNEGIKNQLKRMVAKGAVGHALCFAGPEGIGKSLFAWALAAQLMAAFEPSKDHAHKIRCGQHPDIHVLRPEGKLGLHSMHALRQLSEEVYLPPYEASWKVFILHDAERMLSYSANALLKTFEEPPARTLIILLCRAKAALSPTLLSRCSVMHFQSLSANQIEEFLAKRFSLEASARAQIASQARGSLARALRLAEQGNASRTHLFELLSKAPLGSYKVLKEGVQSLCAQVEASKKSAEEQAQVELGHTAPDQMTTAQRHALDKELEGLVAMALTEEASSLFEMILSWYRDLHALLLGASPVHLANPDYLDAMLQVVQRGDFKPLDQVQKMIDQAYLSLQRSTSLSICLESLLLKLGCV